MGGEGEKGRGGEGAKEQRARQRGFCLPCVAVGRPGWATYANRGGALGRL